MSSTESSKARRVSDVGEEAKQPKRPRLMQPDVVVVVGDEEFEYYSGYLFTISEYFEGALRGDMKEGLTKRIEFPDKNPRHWELLMGILDPFNEEDKIDSFTVRKVLPWFDMLCIAPAMEKCDKTLCSMLPHDRASEIFSRRGNASEKRFSSSLQGMMEIALKYNNLPMTREACFRSVRVCLGSRHARLINELGEQQVKYICSLMATCEEFRVAVLDWFKRYIPPSLQKEQHDEEFFKNKCLPDAIYYYHKSVVAEQEK